MKPDIHPKYEPVTISCACGATHEIRSTQSTFQIDICADCHPFFTGKEKVMDAAGRIDRFNKKYGKKTA